MPKKRSAFLWHWGKSTYVKEVLSTLSTNTIFKLTHPQSVDSQGQEKFLASSTDKQTLTYEAECSNHHPSLSILRSKGLSLSKMKWWAIYTNLPVSAIVRLPQPHILSLYNAYTHWFHAHILICKKCWYI